MHRDLMVFCTSQSRAPRTNWDGNVDHELVLLVEVEGTTDIPKVQVLHRGPKFNLDTWKRQQPEWETDSTLEYARRVLAVLNQADDLAVRAEAAEKDADRLAEALRCEVCGGQHGIEAALVEHEKAKEVRGGEWEWDKTERCEVYQEGRGCPT